MTAEMKTQDAMQLRTVSLENVRAFGSPQTLVLVDDAGKIARWTLILGENGVGKTTLMQALAAMRPVPELVSIQEKTDDAGAPTIVRAELSILENEEIAGFLRKGASGNTRISASFQASTGREVMVGAEIVRKSDSDFEDVKFPSTDYALSGDGPLIFGYGASRHIGRDSLTVSVDRSATKSLGIDLVDLYDAGNVIEELAIAAKFAEKEAEEISLARFDNLKRVVASLLPDCSPDMIEWRGPRVPGRDSEQFGVAVRTPSGSISLSKLSIGYQAMLTLIVDLAWRLYNKYPDLSNPFEGSAIVLIDELELHLHPRWQRLLRSQLLAHFPNVQFVVTTHSPITAQEALSAGGNVCVLKWVGSEVHIINDPVPGSEWRFDQVLASDLFGFSTDRSPTAEALLNERLALIRKRERTAQENDRLRELDRFVASLPTAQTPSSQHLEDMMMRFVEEFPEVARDTRQQRRSARQTRQS